MKVLQFFLTRLVVLVAALGMLTGRVPAGSSSWRVSAGEPPAATGVAAAEQAAGETGKPKTASMDDFCRIRRADDGRPVAVETAIVRYQLPAPNGQVVKVDLVAAIHIAERSYYSELNRRFAGYDAVLFELVAPEDFRVPEGAKLDSQSGIGFMQKALRNMLGLEYQLQCVDYSKKNFVHADVSPQELAELMQKRGESFITIFWKLLQHSFQKLDKEAKGESPRSKRPSDLALLMALLRQDRVMLKRTLAEEMTGMDEALTAISAEDGSSTIITERNKKALEVLRKQIQEGKRNLAIFYGAGHMPDIEARLLNEFHAQRIDAEWLLAWDLTADHSRTAGSR